MDEELQKRSTDCVYFLASPLTCKKGIECEYRHNDIARLNPRDCWYWLAGSCLNPSCGFRHPPLESFTGTQPKPVTSCNQTATPVNKTGVPCFFYYNGYCNKGEKCTFLHGPDDGVPPWQSSKIASGVTDGPAAPEKKASVGSETAERHPSSVGTGTRIASNGKIGTEVNLHQTANNLAQGNTSPGIPGSPYEGFTKGGSHLPTEWSSDDEMEDSVEREEWVESSPGFDVLVNKSEELGYEEDHEYSIQNGTDCRRLGEQYMGYDFEDNIGYDHVHLNRGIVLEEELHDSYNGFDNDHLRQIFGHARPRAMDRIIQRRRMRRPRELGFSPKGNVDLRDYLKKLPRRYDSSQVDAPSRNRPHLHSARLIHRRLSSKVETNATGSFLNGINHQSTSRRSRLSRFRQHFKRKHNKKQHFLSGRGRKSSDDYKLFTAPKTLSQIKEEKRRTKSDVSSVEDEFRGPKSLAEILMDKRK